MAEVARAKVLQKTVAEPAGQHGTRSAGNVHRMTQLSEEVARLFVDASTLGLDLPRAERIYRQMRLIRSFEENLLDLFSRNLLFGTTHTSMGQEANAVGVLSAMDRNIDMIWSNHRCHGHFLAYCGQAHRLFAEIMGRVSGVCGGRGGSQHLHWHNFCSSGIQAGFLSSAVGAAFAEKSRGAIGCAFMGDGTMGEGAVYEALNMASLLSAPLLFVVEDNGIAQTTPRQLGVAGSIADRAKAFGISSYHYKGTDADEIADLAADITAKMRRDGRPAWLHIETVRLGPHSKGDDTRDQAELDTLRKLDPLVCYRDRVSAADEIDETCQSIIETALAEADKDEPACA
jgi:TPP-dependent pyruvate/acetoin dehydrogenase alpha subunit